MQEKPAAEVDPGARPLLPPPPSPVLEPGPSEPKQQPEYSAQVEPKLMVLTGSRFAARQPIVQAFPVDEEKAPSKMRTFSKKVGVKMRDALRVKFDRP